MASNLPAAAPDTSGLVPIQPPLALQEILDNGLGYIRAHPDQVIPQGKAPWLNNSALFGVPFLIASAWMYRTIDTQFGPWEQVQVYVCEIDPDAMTAGEAQIATLHGRALLNQFRSSLPNDLIGMGWFTIGQHTFKVGQKPAYVLKYYEPGKDKPPSDEYVPSPFDADARVSAHGVDAASNQRSPVYEARVADQERARAVASPATSILDSTASQTSQSVHTNGAYDPESELAARGMTWEDAIRVSGWTTVRDKHQAQWEQFFQLYDRMMALKEIPAGLDVGQAAEQVKTRRSGPRASRQDQP